MAQSNSTKAVPQEFFFVDGQSSTDPSLTMKLPSKLPILLRIDPDYDVDHQLWTFDLQARRPNDKANFNLLAPRGHWHGMQPFMLVAMCFTKESSGCGYPNPRVFKLTKLDLELRVRIVDVSVEPTPKAKDYTDYRFKKLKLEIETSPLRTNQRHQTSPK